MFKQIKKYSNISGIAANVIGTGELPTTGTYHAIFLICKTAAGAAVTVANMKAEIKNIIIRLNGDNKRDHTPTFVLDKEIFEGAAFGIANTDGIIPIYFENPFLPEDIQRSILAWGMDGITSFTIEVEFNAIPTLSSIELFAQKTPFARSLGQHVVITKHPQDFTTTGNQEITTLPKADPKTAYNALHVHEVAGTSLEHTVTMGGNDILHRVGNVLNSALLSKAKRTPVANYRHINFNLSNAVPGFLAMVGVKDFRLTLNWSVAPNNYTIYSERIYGLKVSNV